MALLHYQKHFSPPSELESILVNRAERAHTSLRKLLTTYGCVPASVLGGNINAWIDNDHSAPYPGGSDTGIGWTYLRYPHVSR